VRRGIAANLCDELILAVKYRACGGDGCTIEAPPVERGDVRRFSTKAPALVHSAEVIMGSPATKAATRSNDFRAWFDAWPDEFLFFRIDASGRMLAVSPSARSILDYDPAEMVGREYGEFFDPNHPLCGQLRELSERLLAHDSPDLKRCVAQRRDGQYAFLLVRERDVDSAGLPAGKEVIAQDVTARVEAELSLRQSERKYRRLVEGLSGDYIIYTRDARGLITYVSPSVEAVLGYPRERVIGRNWRELVGSGEERAGAVIRRREDGRQGRRLREVVIEMRRRDGARRILEVQEWSIFGIDGRCLAMEGIAKDITDARQAEIDVRELKDDLERRVALRTEELLRINEELRASEVRYRNVVETQTEFIVRWLPDGTRTFVNDAYRRLWGGHRGDLVGTNLLSIIHPDDRSTVDAIRANVSLERPSFTAEVRLLDRDGKIYWTEWTTRAIFDGAGRVVEYQSVGRDVTDLRTAADMLRQKEAHLAHLSRLATMGEMVAGMAHDISQPLHAAKTYAEAARRHLESGRPDGHKSAIDCTKEISGAVSRTVEIIRRLRDFTRSRQVKRVSLDLSEIVQEAVEIMAYEIRRVGATLRLELAPGLPPVEGDRIQLQQVCVNLIKNSCEAMDGTPPEQRCLSVKTYGDDGHVRLAVKDTGCGLAGVDAARVFDAFYTTKADGMGMGLSLCKSIADAHNMRLSFSPNPNSLGMTFFAELPAKASLNP
jgi:PAS domain S-box-containing protein